MVAKEAHVRSAAEEEHCCYSHVYCIYGNCGKRGSGRRVFEQNCLLPGQVLGLIKEEVALRQVACGTPDF